MESDEKKNENLFDIILVNNDEDISAIKAEPPTCQDCFVDFVSCNPNSQIDDCTINYG
ncbi:MAG: hypothetical protein M0P71_09235 [Melioribacteraceae bacterium]|nr:hypothetical protein [Melioribacteraceae bacterium]